MEERLFANPEQFELAVKISAAQAMREYDAIIKEQLTSGIIEKMPN